MWYEKLGEILRNHSKVWKFHFDGLFFFQIYKVWATKIQISYLAWHWKLMQNLNKPWPCGFKNSMKNWCKIVEKLYFDGLFLSKACFSKKISEKLCVMILKGNVKFKRKLTHGLKNDIRNLVNFHASSRKSENLHFDRILLSKAYKDLDEKVQKSYVSWHWRVMQSLKKNWLLVPKMTWEIWWILMGAVESLLCYFTWRAAFVESILCLS